MHVLALPLTLVLWLDLEEKTREQQQEDAGADFFSKRSKDGRLEGRRWILKYDK